MIKKSLTMMTCAVMVVLGAFTAAPAAGADIIDGREVEQVPVTINPALQERVNNFPTTFDADPAADQTAEGVAPSERFIKVYSESMRRWIGIRIILPKDRNASAPVFYLLNGAGGEEDESTTWHKQTDAVELLSNNQVYTVTPMSGAFSYFTDWEQYDAKAGLQKWETFMRYELPAAIEGVPGKLEHARENDRAILGMSMTATSVLNLGQLYPGFYRHITSISGCALTSDPYGATAVNMVLNTGSNYVDNPESMWGPIGSENWRRHDPVLNADRFKDTGTKLYIYSGYGLSGSHEVAGDPYIQGDGGAAALNNQRLVGGLLELGGGVCTTAFKLRLAQLGVDATFDESLQGTHSWGYWRDALHRVWPEIKETIGA